MNADVVVKKRKYCPDKAKCLADKAHLGARVNVSLAFSHFQAGEAGDEERRRAGLLSVGQVGAKHWRLVYASLKNYPLFL